jgi:hypothetical protein
MAKYVLIAFDDDSTADSFANSLKSPDTTVHLVSVHKRPTQFCECPNPPDRSVRGEKWGWWVHRDCGRPKKGMWQTPKNLLAPNESARERQLTLSIVEPFQFTNFNAGETA